MAWKAATTTRAARGKAIRDVDPERWAEDGVSTEEHQDQILMDRHTPVQLHPTREQQQQQPRRERTRVRPTTVSFNAGQGGGARSGGHQGGAGNLTTGVNLNTSNVASNLIRRLVNTATSTGNVTDQPGYNSYISRPPNPALRNKIVYKLECAFCTLPVSHRTMKAILLADTKVELFSTDIPPLSQNTRLLEQDRQTQGCACRIRDTACGRCGAMLGYHVSQPCERCLDARNNGHFWMFYSESVTSRERTVGPTANGVTGPFLYWSQLIPMVDDQPSSDTDEGAESPPEHVIDLQGIMMANSAGVAAAAAASRLGRTNNVSVQVELLR